MNIGLYYRTIRHLTLRQLTFQVWNRLRGRPRLRWTELNSPNAPAPALPITFAFLNQPVTFIEAIDWNYATNGKLWTYNLNYFEWLTQQSAREGSALIHDFIRQTPHLKDGLEPYPISLRVVNWRRFLRAHDIRDTVIEQHLYAQTELLRSRLEYHLGGNHLLENACALIIMAVHFQHRAWFQEAAQLLRAELAEQILSDGGHYERSPVYHQLLTDRLLDVYETLHTDSWTPESTLTAFVAQQLGVMLGWLRAVTFRNGDVPMVNDSAPGVAPSTADLLAKATDLGLVPTPVRLGESGYRMLTTDRLECFIDVGPVGPDHQPGHAHADTFSFVLCIDQQPVVVDTGTSTYQPGGRRTYERSTAAHNTVTVGGQNSSEVWGGFRVGRRARVELLQEDAMSVSARHDGYKDTLSSYHIRTWRITTGDSVEVIDKIDNKEVTNLYRVFFASSIPLTPEPNCLSGGVVRVDYASPQNTSVSINPCLVAAGFNQLRRSQVLTIHFTQTLTTVFTARP